MLIYYHICFTHLILGYLDNCLVVKAFIILSQKMDFRMRNLKENKQNYNSMVEFPRNTLQYTHSPTNNDLANPKIKQLQIRLSNLSESFRADSENNGLHFARLEQRLDQLQRRAPNFESSRVSIKNDTRDRNIGNNGQQLTYLKQGLMGQLGIVRDKSEQIEARQNRLQQELRGWIGQQKQEISIKLLSQAEEIRGSDVGRQRKFDGQIDSLRGALTALQDDISSKMRAVVTLKQQVGVGMQALRDQARGDKDAFSRLVKQVKQSFQSLREAIAKDRQYVKEAIFQIQSTSQDNYNKNARSIDSLAQGWNERQQKIEKRLGGLKDEWGGFKLASNQKIQDCKSLIVNIESNTLEELEALKNRGMGGDIETLKEQLEEWKHLTEQKNLNVFREISNAMKVLRIESKKECEQITKQQEDIAKSVKQLKNLLIDRIEKELAAFTQLSNEQFDALTGELEQANDLIALSNKELKTTITKQNAKLVELISASSAEVHKKVVTLEEASSSLKETMGNLRSQSQKMEKRLNDQIEGLVSSITQDNEEWARQMNQTARRIKEECKKDLQQAIEVQSSNFTQENKKIQGSLEAIKRYMETGLASQRSETVKQFSKTIEEITALINDWVIKSKKERDNNDKDIKDQLSQQKKSVQQDISNVKLIVDDIKKNIAQKASQDLKKSTELKGFVEQTLAKAAKNAQDEQIKSNKKMDTMKLEVQGKIKAVTEKIMLDISLKKEAEAKVKQEESKAKNVETDKKIAQASAKLKAEVQADLTKITKSVEEEASKTNKKTDGITASFKKDLQTQIDKSKKFCIDEIVKVKAQIEIKMKAKDQKALSQINSKRQTEMKQREEELKSKLSEVDKKINDSSAKVKSEIIGQVNRSKTAQLEELGKIKAEIEGKIKSFEQLKAKKEADSKAKQGQLKQKENQLKNRSLQQDKKIQILKKQLLVEVDKNKKYCTDEIAKAKMDMEANAKKDAQAKQRSQELKLKMAEMEKKITDTNVKNKSQVMAQISKSQLQVGKIKSEIESRMKAFEQLKNKKEADSKLKQNELKEKEADLKAKSSQLDKKIDAAKKDITKVTTEEITKVKVDLEAKIHASVVQIQGKMKSIAESTGKGSAEDKAKLIELSGKVESIKGEIDKRLAELKGSTLVNLKTHEQESNKVQDQKLETLKAYFSQAMEMSTAATAAALRSSDQKISRAVTDTQQVKLEMENTKKWLNKVEANVSSDREKNKAVYDKMSSDILDMADSLTVMIAELKPQK